MIGGRGNPTPTTINVQQKLRSLSQLTMRMGYFPTLRRFHAPAALVLILLFLVYFYGFSGSTYLRPTHPHPPGDPASSPEKQAPAPPLQYLPELQAIVSSNPSTSQEPPFCLDRFGPKYLDDLRDHAIQYCEDFSPSGSIGRPSLTCFHSHTAANADRDSFCISHGAVLDPSGEHFALPCKIRPPTMEEQGRGLIYFDSLKRYWYGTGPAVIFEKYFKFDTNQAKEDWYPSPEAADRNQPERPKFLIMVKREGEGNVWHSLMEIWSLTMTLDTLRLTADPSRGGNAFFEAPWDVPNTQVIILDDHKDGPFFSLWRLLTGSQPMRFEQWAAQQRTELLPNDTPKTHNVIMPLPGGSNPQWQNDWADRDCHDAPLLKVFAQRIMNHYGIEPVQQRNQKTANKKDKDGLSLTFLDRKSTRRLVGSDKLIAAARQKFPDVSIQSIDFATIPFPEQIRIIRETDLLVGVHGAGLTHAMFLPEGGVPDSVANAAAVVEFLPEGMDYKGFRNMAQMMGHMYFSTHAEVVAAGTANEEEKKQKQPKVDGDASKGDAAAGTAAASEAATATVVASDSASSTSSKSEPARKKRSASSPLLQHSKRDDNDWHFADVRISEEEFLRLIAEAIAAIQ